MPLFNAAAAICLLVGGLVALVQSRKARQPLPWLGLSAGLLVLAFVQGFEAAGRTSTTGLDTYSAAASLLGGLLTLAGAAGLWQAEASRRAEQAAVQAELERMRMGFTHAGELLAIKDGQGIYLAVNRAFAAFLGRNPDSVIGRSDFDFFPRSQANTIKLEEERVLDKGLERAGMEEMHGAEGLRCLYVRRVPLRRADGEVYGLLFSGQDVTEWQRQAHLADERSQGLLALHQAITALACAGAGPELYRAAVEGAASLGGTPHAALWLAGESHQNLQVREATGKLAGLSGLGVKAGEDVPGLAWQTGQPAIALEYTGWHSPLPALQKLGFQRAIALPVRQGAQVSGALGLYYDQPAAEARSGELERLELFAAAVSAGLQGASRTAARLAELEEHSRQAARLQQRLRLEHVVAAMAARFIHLPLAKIEETLERALQTIASFSGVDAARLVLFSPEGLSSHESPCIYSSDPSGDALYLARLQSGDFQSVLGRLNQLEIVHIVQGEAASPVLAEAAAELQGRGICAYTALPLILNRAMIGYLELESRAREQEWDGDPLPVFKICAEMFVSVLERKWSAEEQEQLNRQVSQQMAGLEQRARENALIAEMGDLLQACRTADEAYPIIARCTGRLLPATSGALYLVKEAADPAERVVAWGDAPPGSGERELMVNECWGLRRGRLHAVLDTASGPVCGHVHEPYPAAYFCAPLVAQGAAAGALHIRQSSKQAAECPFSLEQQQLVARIAEYIALALANLNLRDTLRSQAIRDPLTGLFNRRYMEETLDRELRRANRQGVPVGVIMFDIDRLKPINDTYGHDAGDLLLRSLGELLQRSFRGEDVACRYGGDEFTVVLPEATLADAWRRADQLREAVKKLDLRYDGRPIGPVTLSIGVAAYPDHGRTAENLLLAADTAAYDSKSEGGDRIMIGSEIEN